MDMSTPKTVVFILFYYVVWFSSIFFAHENMGYAALAVSLIISLIQVSFFITKEMLKPFFIWFIAFTLLGYSVDSLFQIFDVLTFEANTWGSDLAPPWILALWLNFAVLCFGMRAFLIKYLNYLPVLAFCGFPLAYLAGMKFGVAAYIYPTLSPFIQGLTWALLFTLCIYLVKRMLK